MNDFLKKILLSIISINFIKFLVIGFSAFLIDYLVYRLFLMITDIIVAKGISFIVATIFTYIMNKNWTFGSHSRHTEVVTKFVVLYIVSLVANNVVNKSVQLLTGDINIAFICATCFCMFLNFFGLRFYVFRKKENDFGCAAE